MPEHTKEQLALERDGFIKTALIAFKANFIAHSGGIENENLREKCLQWARETWDDVLKDRKEYASDGNQS